MTDPTLPRIVLIHGLRESLAPIHEAFAQEWPGAPYFDLLDTSLAGDLACAGQITPAIKKRFMTLAAYALDTHGKDGETKAVLFTCSAFGPAIDAVKKAFPSTIVLKPNEAAFEEALGLGSKIGLLTSFAPSLGSLQSELEQMAEKFNRSVHVTPLQVSGALDALQSGDTKLHDDLVTAAVKSLPPVDVLVLGQFSLARMLPSLKKLVDVPVLATPHSAVIKLRRMLLGKLC